MRRLQEAMHLPPEMPVRFSAVTGEGKRHVWHAIQDGLLDRGLYMDTASEDDSDSDHDDDNDHDHDDHDDHDDYFDDPINYEDDRYYSWGLSPP